MSNDLRDLLQRTTDTPTRPLDAADVLSRARRQRMLARTGMGFGAATVAVMALLIGLPMGDGLQQVEITDQPDDPDPIEFPPPDDEDAEQDIADEPVAEVTVERIGPIEKGVPDDGAYVEGPDGIIYRVTVPAPPLDLDSMLSLDAGGFVRDGDPLDRVEDPALFCSWLKDSSTRILAAVDGLERAHPTRSDQVADAVIAAGWASRTDLVQSDGVSPADLARRCGL